MPFSELASGATLIWAAVLGLLIIGIAVASVVRARPTRSIAHVLYDTEHPDSPARRPEVRR